jgi:signal transduction histidine kinase
MLTVTAALADAVTADEVFRALVDHLAVAIGASSAALWIVEDDTAKLVRARGYTDEAKRTLESIPLSGGPDTPLLDSIRSGEPIWIPSQAALLERYPHLRPVTTPDRRYRVSCLPLKVRGRILGTLALTIEEERETTEDERSFLMLIARYASQAVERLRLFEAESRALANASRLYAETQEARTRAEQLYLFAQAVVAADKIESVYDAALAAIKRALRTDRCAILTYGDDTVMRFRAWSNVSDSYRQAVEGHSPWTRDAIAPQPVLVADAANDPELAPYVSLFRSEGIGALAFIPLVTRGELLGKFMVYFDRPHTFLPHELETARAIANHLASVITRFTVVEKLEETIRQNELFAGVLAHDLRNPLNATMTAAEFLLMEREGQDRKGDLEQKPLSCIISSGRRMSTMINQLLDFTVARTGGGIAVQRQETDLADLCAQAIGEFELAHPEWTIRRDFTGNPRGHWDPNRLLQVFSNLVANAGQHGTQGGGITIKLDGAERDVKIDIHNDGAIPEAILPHLFEPFRTTRHRHSQSCGLGLGLFIVREIVRAHGGTVDVVSSESAGTTFSIRLPRHSVS